MGDGGHGGAPRRCPSSLPARGRPPVRGAGVRGCAYARRCGEPPYRDGAHLRTTGGSPARARCGAEPGGHVESGAEIRDQGASMEITVRHAPSFAVARARPRRRRDDQRRVRRDDGHVRRRALEAKMQGGLMKSLKRSVLGGESLFITTYTAPAEGGWVDVAAQPARRRRRARRRAGPRPLHLARLVAVLRAAASSSTRSGAASRTCSAARAASSCTRRAGPGRRSLLRRARHVTLGAGRAARARLRPHGRLRRGRHFS